MTPQKIIGGRRSQADTHADLSKKLVVDVSNTNALSTATMRDAATNFYDRISHPYDSL